MADQLAKALDGLQNDASRRQEYDEWLQEFRRGVDSWQISYEVLENESYPRELKIFSAQTLRNKIIYDLHQVPRESRMHLKDQVLLLLEKNSNLLSVVGVQLCIALAAFAMQVAEWEHPVEELMSRFDSLEMAPLLFEFLKTLPEEFNSSRTGMVDHSLRLKKTETLIHDTAPLVLRYFLNSAELMSKSGETQCLFFETLGPWLQEVDLKDIIATPLVDWMVQSVSNDSARSAAVDCLITILRETSEIYEVDVQRSIEVLFPKIMGLANEFKSEYRDNQDLLRDMTRLLSEAGESWHVLIAKQPATFLPLLNAISECIESIDGGDLEIVTYSFDVFDKLRTMLGAPLPGASEPMSKQIPVEPFVDVFIKLFQNFALLLQFPESFNGNAEEEETFRDLRYDIGDMLKICGAVAQPNKVLELCYTHLHNFTELQLQNKSVPWQPVEALLFATRAIARIVPQDENEWLPKIFALYQHLPRSDNELVQHAALMLLGRYSAWSATHPEFLGFELNYILNAVWSQHQEVRRAAAHAFLFLCTDASKEMVPFLPDIMQMYNKLTGQTDIESLCKYSDGIGAVMNHLANNELAEAIEFIFKPVQKRAMDLQQQIQENNQPDPKVVEQVSFDIQSLGSLVAMVSAPECDFNTSYSHPLVAEVKSQHSLFMSLMESSSKIQSDLLLEGIARYYIRVIFVMGANISQELPSLMKNAAEIINIEPMTPVLYELASTINQCFNQVIFQFPPQLLNSVWEFSMCMCHALFSEKTTDLLKVQGEIVDHITLLSSVIHHGFHMLCDIATYYSEQFLNTLLVPSVVLSVQVFDLCWDTEALSAVGHFYDDIEGFLPRPGTTVNEAFVQKIGQVFDQLGYSLVLAYFNWFLLKPDPHFEYFVEHLVDLAFRMAPVSSVAWVQKLMDTLPAGTISDEEKLIFSQQIFQLIGSQKFKYIGLEMNNFLKAYSARNFRPR